MSLLRSLLNRQEWVYVLSLLVPLALYDLAFKTVSLYIDQAPTLWDVLGEIRSDILFNVGYMLLWISLFAIASKWKFLRWGLLVVFHLLAVIIFLFTSAYYGYLMHTGSALNYNYVAIYLSELSGTEKVVAAELNWYLELFLVAALLYLIYGPWLVCQLVGHWRRKRSNVYAKPPDAQIRGHHQS